MIVAIIKIVIIAIRDISQQKLARQVEPGRGDWRVAAFICANPRAPAKRHALDFEANTSSRFRSVQLQVWAIGFLVRRSISMARSS